MTRLWNSSIATKEVTNVAKETVTTIDVVRKDVSPCHYFKFLASIRAFYNPSVASSSRVKSPTPR